MWWRGKYQVVADITRRVYLYTVKVPFEVGLLIEAAIGLKGHSLVERVVFKIQ